MLDKQNLSASNFDLCAFHHHNTYIYMSQFRRQNSCKETNNIPTLTSSREREREMGRAPCCDKANVKKGPWSPEEDAKLKDYIDKNGTGGNWIALPHKVGMHLPPSLSLSSFSL